MTRLTLIRSSLVLLTVLISALVGTGTANASDYTGYPDGNSQISRNRCQGLSPNIVDNPYSGSISLWQFYRNGRGRADIGISASQSIWGYDNVATVRWNNLSTRRSGTLRATLRANGATGGATKYFFNVYTGSGKVRIDLQPTNRGAFLTLGASNCSDVFTVR